MRDVPASRAKFLKPPITAGEIAKKGALVIIGLDQRGIEFGIDKCPDFSEK